VRRIVVLGGTGFIGRHLCEALEYRRVPAVILAQRFHSAFLEVHAPRLIGYELGTAEARAELARAEVVIHLRHMSRPASNPEAEAVELAENLLPAVQLFSDLAHENPRVHVIYASSGGQIYGPGHKCPIPETATACPPTPYALGKYLIEQCLRYFADKSRLKVTILRIANPVGRWQLGGRHGLVSAAVASAVTGKPLVLYGAGDNVRDYFDARDLADLLVGMAVDRAEEGVFNIGSGVGWTEREVLALASEVLGREISVEHRPARPFDMPYAVLDVSAASQALAWSPRYRLAATVGDLAAFIGNEGQVAAGS
jgi:UDP-glucose 4-epimerase